MAITAVKKAKKKPKGTIVTLHQAEQMQQEGEWVPNPRLDHPDFDEKFEPLVVFKSRYLIHWRPNPNMLPLDPDQFAIAFEV